MINNRQNSAGAHEIRSKQNVSSGLGIVVIAEQQNLFDAPSWCGFRSFGQRETHVAAAGSGCRTDTRHLPSGVSIMIAAACANCSLRWS